jgi:hypothetical protein
LNLELAVLTELLGSERATRLMEVRRPFRDELRHWLALVEDWWNTARPIPKSDGDLA